MVLATAGSYVLSRMFRKSFDISAAFHAILKTDARVFLFIGLFVMGAYAFMVGSPFKTLDDEFSIINNEQIRDLKNIPAFFQSTYFKETKDYYRPLVYVTYALEYHFFGLNSFYYNLDNVVLHIINSCLVFLLAGILLRNRAQAFFVAFLFGIHPIHWEAVANIAGRAILLCALFTLSGYIFFLKFVREKKVGFLIGALVSYALGLLCKESAGVLIFTAMAYWFLVERKTIRQGLVFWPFFLIAAGYMGIRHVMGISKLYLWPSWYEMALGVLSFLSGLLVYIGLFIFPVGLHFDRCQLLYKSFGDPGFWLTLIIFGVFGFLFVRFYRQREGLTIFCLVWFLIELFPVSQIVTAIGVYPGAISLAEHFVYVASIPVFLLMVRGSSGLLKVWEEKRHCSAVTLRWAFGGILGFFFLMLIQQNIYASNEFLMLRDSLDKDPKNPRLQYSLGRIYANLRDYNKAIICFREAGQYQGNHQQTYKIALGKALVDSGDVLGGVREYEKVIAGPQDVQLLVDNKKAAYGLLVGEYERKARGGKASARDLFALGVFYARLGEKSQAREAFERSWRVDAKGFDALFNIAVISEELRDWPRAQEAYERLSVLNDPANVFLRAAQDRIPYVVSMTGQLKKPSAE
ncbi:MAG: tetratricopeptide repeat protein [Candidatus Omnitrophica bacterium]|nr:tetratricopeptide repeat protein [Candidatus Omnitrophota bacterium]